jgi:hypothetical protein
MRRIFHTTVLALFFSTLVSAALAQTNTRPQNSLYGSFSLAGIFNYNTPYTTFSTNPNTATPNGLWSSGFGADLGFEVPFSSHISSFAEAEWALMNINRDAVPNFPSGKTAATVFNFLLGLKASLFPQNTLSPYLTGGLGIVAMQMEEITIQGPFGDDVVTEYKNVRFLTRTGIGLDLRCDKNLLTFVEFQWYDMDSRHIFSNDKSATMGLFKTGVRLEI